MSVVDPLAAGRGGPRAPALVTPDGSWSYAELARRVDERCSALGRAGAVRAGRLAPVGVEADAAGVVELLAHWRLGAIVAPLNTRLTQRERAEAVSVLRGATVPPGTQAVLWTSGTSGRPRGVALSWDNLEASVAAAADRLGLGSGDGWLATLSPAHVGGLVLVVRSILLGGSLFALGRFDVAEVSDALDGLGPAVGSSPPTHLSLVPTQLLRLLEHRGRRPAPASLRCVLVGGAHAPATLVERAVGEGWPVALTYGATETTSQIATAPPDLVRRDASSVGAPLQGVELRLDGSGEIVVRGPTVALGYVGGEGGPVSDADGWYRTGDLGRLDDAGRLHVVGRRIDRIVTGGVTVDAVEVEEAVRAHPSVVDACVVGVADEEWGELVGASVEPVEGEFDLDALDAWLAERLAAAKRPRVWHLTAALPRNANGKVDRGVVRRTLAEVRGRGSGSPGR